MTDHCKLKSLRQFAGPSGWEYVTLERNPSPNICLISAIFRHFQKDRGRSWIYQQHDGSASHGPARVAAFRCDWWHKQQISLSLCPPKIYEVSLFPRNQRAIHHENRGGGCLATVWKAQGFWRLPCVHMEIRVSCSREWGQFLCLLFQILCGFLIWKCLRLPFSSFSRLCLARSR